MQGIQYYYGYLLIVEKEQILKNIIFNVEAKLVIELMARASRVHLSMQSYLTLLLFVFTRFDMDTRIKV